MDMAGRGDAARFCEYSVDGRGDPNCNMKMTLCREPTVGQNSYIAVGFIINLLYMLCLRAMGELQAAVFVPGAA